MRTITINGSRVLVVELYLLLISLFFGRLTAKVIASAVRALDVSTKYKLLTCHHKPGVGTNKKFSL